MKGILPWEPKNILDETKMIRDWRYRCVQFPYFEAHANVREVSLSTIGVPLVHTRKGSMELPSVNIFNIRSAYFPLCPLEGSWQDDSLTF